MDKMVYRTGGGGIRQSKFWLLHTLGYFVLTGIVILALPLIGEDIFEAMLSVAVVAGLLMVGTGVYSVMCRMRELNSRVTLEENRLIVCDWIGKTRDIDLDTITAVVWTTRSGRFCGETHILSVHAKDENGYVLPVDIGYAHMSVAEELSDLRATIVSRLELQPKGPAGSGIWETMNRLIFGVENVHMWA